MIAKGHMLHADAGIGRLLHRQGGVVGAGGVDGQQFFHLVRSGHTCQGRVGGVHQLPHRAEKSKGQQQHHQPAGKRDGSRGQLPGSDAGGNCHRPVNQPIGEEEGGKVHLHHLHDFVVEVSGLLRQHRLPVAVSAKELEGGNPLDALQIVAGQVLHRGPVLCLQRFNVAAEDVVHRQ